MPTIKSENPPQTVPCPGAVLWAFIRTGQVEGRDEYDADRQAELKAYDFEREVEAAAAAWEKRVKCEDNCPKKDCEPPSKIRIGPPEVSHPDPTEAQKKQRKPGHYYTTVAVVQWVRVRCTCQGQLNLEEPKVGGTLLDSYVAADKPKAG